VARSRPGGAGVDARRGSGRSRRLERQDSARSAVAFALQAVIEAEADERVGAGRYERSESRVTERNGSRGRLVSTKAGHMKIPKLRAGVGGTGFDSVMRAGTSSPRATGNHSRLD
jgi:Transposase, Mutator family